MSVLSCELQQQKTRKNNVNRTLKTISHNVYFSIQTQTQQIHVYSILFLCVYVLLLLMMMLDMSCLFTIFTHSFCNVTIRNILVVSLCLALLSLAVSVFLFFLFHFILFYFSILRLFFRIRCFFSLHLILSLNRSRFAVFFFVDSLWNE